MKSGPIPGKTGKVDTLVTQRKAYAVHDLGGRRESDRNHIVGIDHLVVVNILVFDVSGPILNAAYRRYGLDGRILHIFVVDEKTLGDISVNLIDLLSHMRTPGRIGKSASSYLVYFPIAYV